MNGHYVDVILICAGVTRGRSVEEYESGLLLSVACISCETWRVALLTFN